MRFILAASLLFLIEAAFFSPVWALEKPKNDFRFFESKPGTQAHAFTLPDPHGKKLSLADFKGKAVVLNFWATWCSPCVAEMPGLIKLHEEYKDKGLIVLGVSADTDVDPVVQMVDRFKITFPIVVDAKGSTVLKYGARALPTTYLIKANGEMLGYLHGARSWESAAAREWMEYLIGGSQVEKPAKKK